MKISLIICAYNEENYIGTCLESILKNAQNKFHEIIVVDNNSTDRTKEIAEKVPEVTVVTELKQSPNHAREKGFEVATGDILAFIDADTRMPPGWVDMLITEFKNNPHMVCLTGPYIYYDFSKWKNSIVLLYWHIFVYPVYLIVGYLGNGGNLVIKKETLEKMHGFDIRIPFHGDDTAIAREASKFGKVKLKLDFIMSSSARRLIKEGVLPTLFAYTTNYFSQVFIKKSINTKPYRGARLKN